MKKGRGKTSKGKAAKDKEKAGAAGGKAAKKKATAPALPRQPQGAGQQSVKIPPHHHFSVQRVLRSRLTSQHAQTCPKNPGWSAEKIKKMPKFLHF